ncbi:flagellar associated protein [Toxoplasma gondii ME49]|uniref:Flagellar associated protein n=2 Tax=Toxoplasma gondii TaxID=5811 RepID=S8GMS0_TOXGM|nr:flagellar associated protein [Toxoplasma gondii ME49]EPT29809.1 flagellar associated protein [Toxoplasma gondii ME49]KYF40867.1 flagellar associated protein [Toxoplasma gondii ARI]|eukprot:XP_002365508.2 flagellar associated protein [Toxoplasma gondii ME49]
MEEDATVTQEEPEVFTSSDRGGSVGGSEGESNIREIPSYPLENGEQIRDENLETDAGQETCVAVWASPEDGSLGPAAYVALEETFDQTLKDLPDDPSLDAFRRQYEQLLSALKRSHESELSLLARCKTLTSQISENATKVTAALKLSDEDQSSIDILKKEVQHAWLLVQAGKDREELARETIYSLRKTIEDLNRQIEATETEHITQEAKLEEYLQEREKLLRECDQLAAHNVQMSTDNETMSRTLETLERRVAEAQDELIQTKDVLRIKKLEGDQEQRRREKIEKELKDMKALIEQKQTEIQGKQATIEQQRQETEHLQAVVASLQAENEKENKRFMEITGRITDTENRLNEQIITNSKMQAANIAREAELRDQTEVINKMKADKERVTKMHDLLKRKMQQTEDDRKALDDQHAALKSEISGIEKEVEALKQQAEADKKNIGNLLRERDLLSKNLLRTDDATKKHEEALKRHEAHALQLQREAERYRKDIEIQQAKIRELESHRDKSGAELSRINQKYLAVLEEIKGGDNQVTDLQKTITELRNKLATQKSLYESVRSDRNLYSRNLIESLDEISEMKQKFKILYHQIEQLKEEVKQKDASLIKGHFEQHKIVKDNEKITSDLHSAQHKLSSLQQIVLSQKREIKKLEATIQDAETERSNQKKEYEVVLSERDMLGTQLLRRSEELSLLYEKIKIQQSTLQKGEAQYRARLTDIKLLRQKISAARRELVTARGKVACVDDLKREVYQLQRELLQERTKVKALSESLENPMNVHRWRRLEGSDPSKLEMLAKIQSLQKRLIAKTDQVIDRDLMIQEKEKLYVELKTKLAAYPGPQMVDQMQVFQRTLREKTAQLKAMTCELKTCHKQVILYKDEIAWLNKELAVRAHLGFALPVPRRKSCRRRQK